MPLPRILLDWRKAVRRARLPGEALRVAWALHDQMGFKYGLHNYALADASASRLAKDTGMDRSNVSKALKRLESHGLIVRVRCHCGEQHRQKGHWSVWQANIPS